jgi:dienelactone hydrolase
MGVALPAGNQEAPMTAVRKLFTVTLLGLLVAGCATRAETPEPTTARAEPERIRFASSSPYDFRDVLDGSADDPSTEVFADFTLPAHAEGPVPAMVFVHGSGGWSPKHELYLEAFLDLGVATFRLDSFRPREVEATIGEQVTVTEAMMASDAFHALRWLARHPRIDPDRIGIMGGSKGGAVALLTAWEPLRRAAMKDDLRFALHVPLYPPCATFRRFEFTGAPIHIHSGALDEWTPAAPCVALTEALHQAGYRAQITVHADAYHSFDSLEPPHEVEDAFNTRTCRFAIEADGTTVETGSGLRLDTRENRRRALGGCATRGVVSGRNAAAARATMDSVCDVVRHTLRRRE